MSLSEQFKEFHPLFNTFKKIKNEKGDWKKWPEPFVAWTKSWFKKIEKTKEKNSYPELFKYIQNKINEKLLNLQVALDIWENEAVQLKLIDENYSLEYNIQEQIYLKLLTTLIYKNNRHMLPEEPCLSII